MVVLVVLVVGGLVESYDQHASLQPDNFLFELTFEAGVGSPDQRADQ